MKIAMYDAAGVRLPDLDIPDDVVAASATLARWITQQPNPEFVSLNGLGRVVDRDGHVAQMEAALIHEYHELVGGGDYIGNKLMTAQDKIDYMIARVPK